MSCLCLTVERISHSLLIWQTKSIIPLFPFLNFLPLLLSLPPSLWHQALWRKQTFENKLFPLWSFLRACKVYSSLCMTWHLPTWELLLITGTLDIITNLVGRAFWSRWTDSLPAASVKFSQDIPKLCFRGKGNLAVVVSVIPLNFLVQCKNYAIISLFYSSAKKTFS